MRTAIMLISAAASTLDNRELACFASGAATGWRALFATIDTRGMLALTAGSLLCAIAGAMVLRWAVRRASERGKRANAGSRSDGAGDRRAGRGSALPESTDDSRALREALRRIHAHPAPDGTPQAMFDEMVSVLVELTGSAFGFLGEVARSPEGAPYLKILALSETAWTEELRAWRARQAEKRLEFRNLGTLFGAVLLSGRPVIANDPANDPRRGGTPYGHPRLDSFLGVPLWRGNRLIAMVGLANRPDGYDACWVEFLEPVLDACAHALDAWQNAERDHRVEAELRAAHDYALEATRLKSEFLANLSHELRTPMNGVIAVTDLALGTELTPEQREYLTIVRGSAQHLLRLLNDMLDFARVEAGRVQLDVAPFSLRAGLDEALGPLRVRARQKGLMLRFAVAAEVPDRVSGDLGRVRQILVNLVDNAIKFTSDGQIEVRVTLDSCDATDVRVQIAVADTGIGVPEELQEVIFEPFRQADGSTARRYGGSGLGLAISARLAERMGGRLWVESVPGVGSAFRLTVPFERVAEDSAATMALPASGSERATAHAASTLRAAAKLRILVAEDNPVNRLVTVRLLEKAGHSVVTAENGREAVAVAAHGDIDLVLMDVQMPEMDGLAATAAIRRLPHGARLPIVALTAHVLPGDRERCLAAGMNEYLTKPIEGETLLTAVARVTSGPDTVAEDREPPPPTPALERDWLLANLDHDPALLAELVVLYRAETPLLLRDLRAACAEDAGSTVERLAHRLKGSLATLGARRAAAAAARLEAAGHARAVGVYTRLADDLAREVARLDDELFTLAAESAAGERATVEARESGVTPRH